ncbi:MAG: CPBP family intramembrane metalloprotease, partial [Betaproteobacteria bacterium]|nr:CPBP family intramembrane metalloprotease [Betaproteobacteria bacterium]
MSAAAARFLALADRGGRRGWRYWVGLPAIVVLWLQGGGEAYEAALVLPLGVVTEFVALNASILVLLVATVLVVTLLHRRSWRTLVTPYPAIDWRRMAAAAAVWGGLLLLFALIEAALYPGRYVWTFEPALWWPFAAAVLLLTPLQCFAEELAFRGYLVQGLGRLWAAPWFVIIASALLFTLPHLLNPEVGAYGFWLMAANYFAMGLFLAWITLRDGRLELAIGAHAANNVLLALTVNYEASVFDTPSMFTADTLDPAYSLLTLVISAAVFALWAFRNRVPGRAPAMAETGFSPQALQCFAETGFVIERGLLGDTLRLHMLAAAERD